jgi:exosortase A-associated hydrolase 2
MAALFQPFFLEAGSGQRFCLFHPAQSGHERGAVLFVHPFAEEMNKTRRMAALQSHALAKAGYAVLQIDLLGCGDSSGDFGEASWHAWVDDVLRACRWLRARSTAPLWLWGLRGGCLLAAEAARAGAGPCNLIFWQPMTSGKVLLQQFLRLKVAGDALAGREGAAGVELRRRIADGDTVDVAGYRLNPELARGLERATLAPSRSVERLEWIEIGRHDGAIAPASSAAIAQWEASGCEVSWHAVAGPAFWQTTEIEEAPALLSATLMSLTREVAA